ncbi:hypothetical protein SERLA73DRAFT_183288 [Serpula lacrymans var. lacrymans S7.3]|uniref:Uncharacterized protein n=2 Tax=Serpula lacrymans var. lacrymans TaxID=341189 RepID=F8PZL4_SERL3|nr:uncharacterized protein SERLADRAFT_470366 [Serpula lacrymans var. lacrymans S7.9]EGN98336.1 hypothetical protein SERLA73DRAFT_183288 [Serpula lacrymans var. lacrymans S7.3]EGO23902.1 hypothetical protein SERLADRAFT_470366 [Serpula lacrymans var. lacrymans S7.9]
MLSTGAQKDISIAEKSNSKYKTPSQLHAKFDYIRQIRTRWQKDWQIDNARK